MAFLSVGRNGRTLPPWLAVAVTSAGVFLASLDQTVVVTALPDIFLDIELPIADLDQSAWIVTGYLLGFTVAMPLMGRVSDIHGHGRVYLAAMAVFMVGSALVAMGDSLWWIVGARVLQAAGGGALVPVTIAIAHESLPASRRGIAIGIVVAVAEAGAVLGPLWGGLLLHTLSWRWIFWINIPVGAAIMALALLVVGNVRRPALRVDYVGGLLLGGSIACLALGLSGDAVLPSAGGWRAGFLAGSGALLLGYVQWERRSEGPLLPLSLFRRVPFTAANLSNFLVGGALILALVNIPLMTDTVLGEKPLEGGLRLLRLTVMIPVGALLGALMYQRLGFRPPMLTGLSLAAVGFWLLSRWPLEIGDPRLTLELMVGGLGFGLVITPITIAVLDGAAAHQKATASALVTVMRMVGMIVGVSALSSFGQDRFRSLVGGIALPVRMPGEMQGAFEERAAIYDSQVIDASLTFFHEMFLAALVVCLVALVPAFLMGRRSPRIDDG